MSFQDLGGKTLNYNPGIKEADRRRDDPRPDSLWESGSGMYRHRNDVLRFG